MKSQKYIWLQLLSYNSQSQGDVFPGVFKVMAMLITGYYLACMLAFFGFIGHHCPYETAILLLTFLTSMIALSLLLYKKVKTSVLFFTVLLPLCVFTGSVIRPSIDFSTSILLIAILSLLVTYNPVRRVIKFFLHALIYVFIQLRYDLIPETDTHQHLSLFNIILLPFGCLFFIMVFNQINKAFRFYHEQHQLKRQRLAEANKTLKNLLNIENRQKQKLVKTVAFKQQLISILSHDIRTPLYAYKMLIEGYEKKYYNDRDLVKEFVNSKEELIKIDEMTSDLVRWARADAAPQQQEGMNLIQLTASLKAIEMIYAKSLKNKSLRAIIATDIDDTELLCIGRRQLETILRNLLSNAIKFSNEGSSVCISLRPDEEKPSHVLLTVKDFGVGMTQRKLKDLNKHSLVSSRGTADETGLGIGLSLVFDILNRHELKYKIESKPGEGTAFKIWIHRIITEERKLVEDNTNLRPLLTS